MDSVRIRRAFAATVAGTAMAGGALLATTTGASAADTDDPRAVAHDGNAVTCEQAGLPGELLDPGDVDYVISADGRFLTILAEHVFVTGVVVKGGPGYNVYDTSTLGGPPWEDLRSPLNKGGNVPQISHWFACGEDRNEGS